MMNVVMVKIKTYKNRLNIGHKQLALTVFSLVLILSLVGVPIVKALTNAEINERNRLQAKIAQQEAAKEDLGDEASSIEEIVAKLQAKIATYEKQIRDSQERISVIQGQINEAEAELNRQKTVLGENIKASYLDGEISTIEMLASSNDLSEFVDKQQYRNSVQDQIKETLDKITQLKYELNAKKDEVERYLKDQEKAHDKVAEQKAEQNRLLGLNKDQQAALSAKIKQNSAKVAALNAKQVAENLAAMGGNIPQGVAGGGGYKYGNAVCLWRGYADPPCRQYDWGFPSASSPRNLYDEWGYGYRNCTSWGAFRVVQAKGYTPAGLTGLGHAKYWPSNTSAPVNGNPSGGAVIGITSGTYGHVRFVEAVNGDGSIVVSDYNLGGDGKYRAYNMTKSKYQSLGMQFIHF